jgi:hypothetical protein
VGSIDRESNLVRRAFSVSSKGVAGTISTLSIHLGLHHGGLIKAQKKMHGLVVSGVIDVNLRIGIPPLETKDMLLLPTKDGGLKVHIPIERHLNAHLRVAAVDVGFSVIVNPSLRSFYTALFVLVFE